MHALARGAAQPTFDAAAVARGGAITGLVLVFMGLFFKVAAVPLHVYAADVYEGAASPVTGLLGFVPKFGGFIALIKVLAVFNWSPPQSIIWLLWIIAAATMTFGNALGLIQRNVKRTLAYSSIAHTGYMLVALLIGPVAGRGPLGDGVAALLFYVAVYGTMNLGAFAVLAAYRTGERELETFDDLVGLSRRSPATALAFAVCVFSLMGLPPTAGFLAKLYILSSALSVHEAHALRNPLIWLVLIVVANTAVGAAYYLRMIAAAYSGGEPEPASPYGGRALRLGLALCTLPMLVLFVLPTSLTRQAQRGASILRRTVRVHDIRVTKASLPAETDVPRAHP
jgi:NADH-quinone oxidoreductase subunit N